MIRILLIAYKDVRHSYCSPASLAPMLVAPLLLAGAIGAAFGSGESYQIAQVKTVVVNQDRGAGAGLPATGAAVVAALTSPELADLLVMSTAPDPASARAAVERGEAAVAVLLPPGLSSALYQPAWGVGAPSQRGSSGEENGLPAEAAPAPTAEEVRIEIYKEPSLTVGPEIVATVVRRVVGSFEGAAAAAGSAATAAARLGLTDPQIVTSIAQTAARNFTAHLQEDLTVDLAPRSPLTPESAATARPNVATQVLVGMMVFFTLFGASIPARSILDEHRTGTLPRLFTTPTPRGLILGGKYIAVFLVVLLQTIVLLVAGRLLYGARWGEVGPVAALTVGGALLAASLGLVTVSFAKTPAQAGAASSAIFVFLGLISGSFTGTADLGQAFNVLRRISPLGWLLEAWDDVIFGASWGDIGLPLLVVVGFVLAFLALATFFFRRRYA